MKFPEKLQSRKFWITVLGALAVLLTETLGINISSEVLNSLSIILAVGIGAIAADDVSKNIQKNELKNKK